VCVVGEDLESDRINVLSIVILHKVQLDQLRALEWFSIDRVCSMLLDPWQDVGEVEYGTFGCADWVLEWLKGHRAEVER
jgi:hypothetical protein